MPQNPLAGASPDIQFGLGRVFRAVNPRINAKSYLDAEGVKVQSTVVSVGGAGNTATYSLRLLSTTAGLPYDKTFSFTTDASGTAEELRDGLRAAILADPSTGLFLTAINVDTAEFTLVFAGSRTASISFPANPSTHLTGATVAPGFVQYLYGQAVEKVASPSSTPAALASSGIRNPVLPTLGTLVLTVDTNANSETSVSSLAHSYSDGQIGGVDVLSSASGASASATATLIGAAAEALWPNASVVVASPNVTVTFPAGEEVAIVVGPTNSGSLAVSGVVTAAGAVPELALIVDAYDTAPLESRTGVTSVLGPIPGSAPLCAGQSGTTEWVVTAPGTSFASSRVYADISGVLYDAPSVARVPFNGPKWSAILDSTQATLEY